MLMTAKYEFSFDLTFKIMSQKEFSIHLFSTPTDTHPGNKHCSFTTQLATPLFLPDDYEVALVQTNLPRTIHSAVVKNSLDSIIFHDQFPADLLVKKDKTSDEKKSIIVTNSCVGFLNYVLRVLAPNPMIYTRQYFSDFLNENFEFNQRSLIFPPLGDHRFKRVESKPTEFTQSFTMNLKNVLGYEMFIVHNLARNEEELEKHIPSMDFLPSKFEKFPFTLPKNSEMTLNQILHSLLTQIYQGLSLYLLEEDSAKLLQQDVQKAYAHNKTLDKKASRNNVDKRIVNYMRLLRSFLKTFVNYFVRRTEMILGEIDSTKYLEIREDSYILVYLDLVSNSLVGNQKSNVIAVLDRFSPNNDGSKSNIIYHTVEKKVISSISVLLTDIFGEKIQFSPSYIPTHICLKFRPRNTN
jgi:hypothetical protein